MASVAELDLKQCSFFLQDGYSDAGAVNLMAGYTAGATTMTVDGIVGIIATGTRFSIASETGVPIHTVTAHSETSSNTTSITFTPALAAVVADNAVIVFLPRQIEVRIGDGTMSWTEKVNRIYRLNKGLIDHVKNGDQAQMEVSLDFTWLELIGMTADPVTPYEAFHQLGNAATWVSSDPDTCQPYAVDIVVIHLPVCSTEQAAKYIFPKFRYEQMDFPFKDGLVAVKGACNALYPTITRYAA